VGAVRTLGCGSDLAYGIRRAFQHVSALATLASWARRKLRPHLPRNRLTTEQARCGRWLAVNASFNAAMDACNLLTADVVCERVILCDTWH